MSESHHDEIPVKDINEAHRTKSLVMDKDRVLRRDEYHDRILQLSDENMVLKKHVRKHEERAKQLEAKLSRILSEKKQGGRHDFEAEENKCRILELEYQVGMLKDRLQVAKQQLVSYTRIFPIHPKQAKAKQTKVSSSNSNAGVASSSSYELSEQVEVLLLEAKAENQALENQLHVVREQLLSTQRELSTTKELLQIKEISHEDELALITRAQPSESEHKKQKLADNIQLIRLQRDSRRASSWLSTLETQCKALEASLTAAQEQNQQLESQLNACQDELREAQQQNLNLQKEVEDGLANLNRVKELETQIKSLQDENTLLKEAKEALQTKAQASAKKAREVENEEATLKSKLSQMELTLKKEIQSKTDLYSDVTREKTKCSQLTETLNELQRKFSAMEEEVKKMEIMERRSESSEKISHEPSVTTLSTAKSSQESITVKSTESLQNQSVNNNNVETIATTTTTTSAKPSTTSIPASSASSVGDIINNNVQESITPQSKNSDAVLCNTENLSPKRVTSCEQCKSLEKDLAETRSTIGKLHDEFIKTKNLLRGQMATNRECHREIEALSTKLEKADKFHHEKLQEFMKVLEERATQMLTLEKNLEIIKSQSSMKPTQPIPFTTPPKLMDSGVQVHIIGTEKNVTEISKEQKVKIGEELTKDTNPKVEIFLDKFVPTKSQDYLMNESLFATWDYDEQGTKYTPIVRNGVFSSGSTHKIFTDTLQDQVEVQIHQALGKTDCQTLGKGILSPDSDTCVLNSTTEPKEPIGELKYKFMVYGADRLKKRPLTSTPTIPTISITTTPPSPCRQIPVPPQPLPSSQQSQQQQKESVCVPKPKPRQKSPAQPEILASSSYGQQQQEATSDSSDKTHGSKSITKTVKAEPQVKVSSHGKQKSGRSKLLSRDLAVSESEHREEEEEENENKNNEPSKVKVSTSASSTTTTSTITNEYQGATIKIVQPSHHGQSSLPSPKKPILRRESASPEVKKKLLKKVTVAEVVEERRIPSSDEEKYIERTSLRQRARHHELESMSSSSADTSGDIPGGGNNVVMVQPKQGPDKANSNAKSTAMESSSVSSKQNPKIKVLTIDSKENISNPSGIPVKKPTADSTTELDQSSGSGDEANPRLYASTSKNDNDDDDNHNNNNSSSNSSNSSKTSSSRSKARRKPRKQVLQLPHQQQQQQQQQQAHSKDLLQVSSGVDESFENSFESSSLDSDTLKQTVRIEISHVIFNARCRVWTDPKIKRFYVEYRFLNYNPEELETPNSLPKPQPGKKSKFNFVKVFVIDTVEKRKALLQQIQEKKRLRFTLVSEPGEDDTLDCEDIGYAYVPMNVLVNEDLIQEELVIFDAENPRHKIGVIVVSIQAHDLIKTL